MSSNSKIEWTEHTFNPWWGCTKISEGCAHCYAETWARRTGFVIWGQDAERRHFTEKHWAEPHKWNAAAEKLGVMHRVFCGSMCDIFENRMDLDSDRIRVFRLPKNTPNLLWLFLTKRPLRAVQSLPHEWQERWPRNVMIGVTLENQDRLRERMEYVKLLHAQYPGVSMFASCEPLLSALEWRDGNEDWLQYFDWVIGGGESGPGARPMHPGWIRKLRNDCEARTDMGRPWPVPFLFKQWGEYAPAIGSLNNPRRLYVWANARTARLGEIVGPNGFRDSSIMERVGKSTAGRVLDGRTWDGVPHLEYGPQLPGLCNYGAVEVLPSA